MPTLRDFYIHRYGEAAKVHGDSINGPCPFCDGGVDRFIIWTQRNENLGKTCMEHGIPGVYFCRQCEAKGDTIEYLMKAEGMDFHDACAELGIEPSRKISARPAPVEKPQTPSFSGREVKEPGVSWLAQVEHLNGKAVEALGQSANTLRWLSGRGITPTMAQRYELGCVKGENGKPGLFRWRSSFGLEPGKARDGREVKKFFIPRGVSIPSRNRKGDIVMFRIRRPDVDLQARKSCKYWELTGGSSVPYYLPAKHPGHVFVTIVVEGEFDAMLLHSLSGESLSVMAMRSNSNKPDTEGHRLLSSSDLILVCLDTDEAGAKGVDWWKRTYRQAVHSPIPGFKDPGDAWKAGMDVRLWLEAVVPGTVSLAPVACGPAYEDAHGSMDTSSGRLSFEGEGAKNTFEECEAGEVTADVQDNFADLLTEENLKGLRAALPWYLDMEVISQDVLALAVLWRGAPIHYVKLPAGGFEWNASTAWAKRFPAQYDRFLRLATSSRDVADWLDAHSATDISSRNFLQLFEDCK